MRHDDRSSGPWISVSRLPASLDKPPHHFTAWIAFLESSSVERTGPQRESWSLRSRLSSSQVCIGPPLGAHKNKNPYDSPLRQNTFKVSSADIHPGSSRGLGLATTKAFLEESAGVILNYHDSEDNEMSQLVNYPDAFSYRADITKADQTKALFNAALHHFGKPITRVVNNAMVRDFSFDGNARLKLADLRWANFDSQMQGFLRGALNPTQGALSGFEYIGFGYIINIGSNLSQNPVVLYHDDTACPLLERVQPV